MSLPLAATIEGGESLADDIALPALSRSFLRTSAPLPLESCDLLSISNRVGLLALATSASSFIIHPIDEIKALMRGGAAELDKPLYNLSTTAPLRGLAFAQDGASVVALMEDRSIAAWRVGQSEPFLNISIDGARSIYANPSAYPHLVAVVAADAVHVVDLEARSSRPLNTDLGSTPTSACWSVKGKQLASGLGDGRIVQLSPDDGAIKATLPAAVEGARVIDLRWIENDVFIATLAQEDEDPALYVATRANGAITYTTLTDPAPAFGLSHLAPRRYAASLKSWPPYSNAVFLASAPSTDVGLIGRKDAAGGWEVLELEETSRPTLPFSSVDKSSETAPLGVALDVTLPTDASKDGEARRLDPRAAARGDDEKTQLGYIPPTLWVLDSDGSLGAWSILNLDERGAGGYSEMVRPVEVGAPSQSSAQSEASAAPPASPSASKPAPSAFGAAPASSPSPSPSGFGQPSAFGQANSASSTSFGQPNAFGGGSGASAFGAKPPSTPGGFGSPSAFGAASKPASSFGTPTAFGGSKPATPSGSGFGATSAFGSKPSPAPSGSGFGTPSAFAAPSNSGGFGAFGSKQSTPSAFAAPSTGAFSGFGAAKSSGFGAFGSNNNGAQPAAGGSSIFGSGGSLGGSSSTAAATPFGQAVKQKPEAPVNPAEQEPDNDSQGAGSFGFGGMGSMLGGSSGPSAAKPMSTQPFAPPSQQAKSPFSFASESKQGETKSASGFASSTPPSSSSPKPSPAPAPAFSFAPQKAEEAAQPAKTSPSPFNFASSSSNTPAPTFGFASAPEKDDKTPAFGFAPAKKDEQGDEKKADGEAAAQEVGGDGKGQVAGSADGDAAKPTFGFAPLKKDDEAKAKAAPAFSFAPKPDTNEKAQADGAEKAATDKGQTKAPPAPPPFSFAQKKDDAKSDKGASSSTPPASSSPASTPAAEKPSAFSFAPKNDDAAKAAAPPSAFGFAPQKKAETSQPPSPSPFSFATTKKADDTTATSPSEPAKPSPFSFAPKQAADKASPTGQESAFSFAPQKKNEKSSSPVSSPAAASPSTESTKSSGFNFAPKKTEEAAKPASSPTPFSFAPKKTDAAAESNATSSSLQSDERAKLAAPSSSSAPAPFSFAPKKADAAAPPSQPQQPFSFNTAKEKSNAAPQAGPSSPSITPASTAAPFSFNNNNNNTMSAPSQARGTTSNRLASSTIPGRSSPLAGKPILPPSPEKSRAQAPAPVSPSLPPAVASAPSLAGPTQSPFSTAPPSLSLNAPTSPAASNDLQSEFLQTYLTMDEELNILRTNIAQCATFQAEIREARGASSLQDLAHTDDWTFGDLPTIRKLEDELAAQIASLESDVAARQRSVHELEASLLKAEAKREEAARLLRAHTDPEFAKLVRIRQLGPEHAANQTKLRALETGVAQRVGELESFLVDLKGRIREAKIGGGVRSSARAPSLDSIQRTVRNLSITATTKSLELDDLSTELEMLRGRGGASRARTATPGRGRITFDDSDVETPSARPRRDPFSTVSSALGDALPRASTPSAWATSTSAGPGDAPRAKTTISSSLRQGLLTARREPIRTTPHQLQGAKKDFARSDLNMAFAKGPVKVAASRPPPQAAPAPAPPQQQQQQAAPSAPAPAPTPAPATPAATPTTVAPSPPPPSFSMPASWGVSLPDDQSRPFTPGGHLAPRKPLQRDTHSGGSGGGSDSSHHHHKSFAVSLPADKKNRAPSSDFFRAPSSSPAAAGSAFTTASSPTPNPEAAASPTPPAKLKSPTTFSFGSAAPSRPAAAAAPTAGGFSFGSFGGAATATAASTTPPSSPFKLPPPAAAAAAGARAGAPMGGVASSSSLAAAGHEGSGSGGKVGSTPAVGGWFGVAGHGDSDSEEEEEQEEQAPQQDRGEEGWQDEEGDEYEDEDEDEEEEYEEEEEGQDGGEDGLSAVDEEEEEEEEGGDEDENDEAYEDEEQEEDEEDYEDDEEGEGDAEGPE